MECVEDREALHGVAYKGTGESGDSCPGPTGRADDAGHVNGDSIIMALEDWAVALVVIGSVLAVMCLLSFVYYWFVLRYRVASSSVSMKGKTIIITGASSGIGKATALGLARRGARLILACRNEEKTAQVISEIKQKVPQGPEILYRHLDLASLQSVRKCAEQITREESHIDTLINNAGRHI
ncbi:retinol dehydrogenase 13-like [Patiria miniata]|uniref:Dehydrogenase/reductase SDR family member 11 n=1 Tax=Patiria miniata TaxID=46514 RepID=A0A913ZY19_PATMI|nr:retinol dehydrogenase 13-like [Patiria miniata]